MAEQESKSPLRLFAGLLIITIGGYLLVGGLRSATDNKSPLVTPNKTVITIETVATSEERQVGLSNRDSIDDSAGMLFEFDEFSKENCFWMKDMRFAIDMIWLDKQKKVVTVTENIGPETYPESFCPEADAKYGLEVGAGRTIELGIAAGETLRF